MSQSSKLPDVTLRRLRGDFDGKLCYRWRNDPRVYKWCRQADVIHPEPHKKWFERQQEDASMSMYMIENANDERAGVCGLTSIDYINRRAEVSLYIDPDEQRKGYGYSAAQALMDKAFNVLNLNSVWGEAFDGSPAIRLFRRMGFKEDGRRRQFYFREGKYVDAILFSLTRDEYVDSNRDTSRDAVKFSDFNPSLKMLWFDAIAERARSRKEKNKT